MAATFEWKIANTERYIENDGIFIVHWRCNGTEGDHTASAYGTVSFTPDPSADGFVAYDSLTEETVLGWVNESVDKTETEAAIQSKLDLLANPVTASGMPWAE
jgi:hypothetical protein